MGDVPGKHWEHNQISVCFFPRALLFLLSDKFAIPKSNAKPSVLHSLVFPKISVVTLKLILNLSFAFPDQYYILVFFMCIPGPLFLHYFLFVKDFPVFTWHCFPYNLITWLLQSNTTIFSTIRKVSTEFYFLHSRNSKSSLVLNYLSLKEFPFLWKPTNKELAYEQGTMFNGRQKTQLDNWLLSMW